MSLDAILRRFTEQAPVATMVRASMANILSPQELDAVFHDCRERQYQDTLLFSSVVELLSLVVTKAQPSLHAAYQSQREQLGVSVAALYYKISRTELAVTRELVRRTARRTAAVSAAIEPNRAPVLPGYRTLILDGSHLAATEHRLEATRRVKGGPLPGQGLVVLDADRRLIADFLPCADGHAKERSLLADWADIVEPGQLWIADRNFCTKLLIFECKLRKAFFLVRHHAALHVETCGESREIGRCDSGVVYEQAVRVCEGDGEQHTLQLRRITIRLDAPTADGDREIHLLTNLPAEISALRCVELYRLRWGIEAAFGELTLSLRGEIDTLGYPAAALLAYAIALLTYNLLALAKAAMRAVHGAEQVDQHVSTYYLASEVTSTWSGLEIAVPPSVWQRRYGKLPPAEFATELIALARHTQLRRYRKHPRGPKRKPPSRSGASPHVSTARLLATPEK